MKKYVIIGKRWFDKINGNTYHSVSIIDVNTNKQIAYIPISYGYDEQYKHTAYKKLIELKLAKKEEEHNHEMNHKRFIYICNDVGRRKDL